MKIIGTSAELETLLEVIQCPYDSDSCPAPVMDCWSCIEKIYGIEIDREII